MNRPAATLTRNRNRLLLLLFGAALLLAPRPAHAQTVVDPANGCGQTLGTPGEYVLAGDLSCTTATDGVVITASNVVFHLAGHTISGSVCDLTQNISGIVVSGGLSGVQIDGGTIAGFNDGILLYASGSRASGMTVRGACAFGIVVSGRNNRLETSVVKGSGIDGVDFDRALGGVMTANDVYGNARNGVSITDFSNDNIVENNIIRDNGRTEGYGVVVNNGTRNTIRNNAISRNFDGIGIDSPGNLALGNTVNLSAATGISISVFGAASTVRRNTVLSSAVADMSDGSASCAANAWTGNTFVTDFAGGAPDGGPGVGCIR